MSNNDPANGLGHPNAAGGRLPVFVLNMHRNFTGVSATAAAVVRQQLDRYDVKLVGGPLPGCPEPLSWRHALMLSRAPPPGRPFHIWHVRRNPEMRAGIFGRDVLRLPVRLVFTSSAQRRHSLIPRWLISRMDAIIATTDEAARFVGNVRAVVPHGVDVERFHPATSRDQAWAASGYPGTAGIATIGRIREEKGTDRFVTTMIAALPRLPGHTALVIGKAAPEHVGFLARLRQQVADAGLSERILFPGEIDAEAMPGLVRGLSLLVALPRYEGYGVTPLEAMASGVPFVASNAGWFEAFSDSGAAGLVVPDGAPQVAADRAVEILSDTARHQAMALAARATAVDQFSVAAEAEAINKVYEDLWQQA
ncbi:glycosyltransferase family 4 protein [Hoeflea sp. G2-23]|uniref:Glycosyltransferase family 4 protein n=1 Tax=Hoeflea algicola TaxID=2983763 RepID=A0ABT3Z867_9HYPH|nr:glycosyltransferase family 4 protein [Hoeflea algicola]MCY0147971.1 glycosyltransferase family 4 protein [Hoeflea algicola]